MRRIPSLDGLRAVSIGLVLLGHLYGVTGYPKNRVTWFLGEFSHFGVQIFFVISGYLITALLLEERSSRGRISLSAFYLRRTFRIFPAAYVYIVFATLMRFLLHHPFPLKSLAFALTYMSSYNSSPPWVLGHLWSLSVEEQFYLLWPVLLVLAFRYRVQACWAVLVLAPLCRLLYVWYAPGLAQYAFPANADALAMGCLLAMYTPQLRRLPGWVHGGPACAAICVGSFAAAYWIPRQSVLMWGVVPALVAVAIHVLVTRQDRALNNAWTRYLGGLSYSLYLFQQPFFPQSATTKLWSSFPLNFPLAIGLALMSYYLVEQPLIRVGHRMNARLLREQDRRRLAANGAEDEENLASGRAEHAI